MDSANILYTVEDVEALPENRRVELINGVLYDMATPTTTHQRLVQRLSYELYRFIQEHKGTCEVFPAPFGVYLTNDNRYLLEPDVTVVCDPQKIDEKGCHGTPDFVAEVVSKNTQNRDYGIKLFKYRTEGVREYWIVNPLVHTVTVYRFDAEEEAAVVYGMDEEIPVGIFEGLTVQLEDSQRNI